MNHQLKVRIPNCCIPEIQYVIQCLLDEFLSITYCVEFIEESNSLEFVYGSKKIIFANTFFSNNDVTTLLVSENIPDNGHNGELFLGSDSYKFYSIYGGTQYSIEANSILFDLDIVASTFFLLVQWESNVINQRDEHDRVTAKKCFIVNNNMLHRPIVNEYVELLWASLVYIGYDGQRKSRCYTVNPTHDIDRLYLFNDLASATRSIGYSIIKKPSINDVKSKLLSISKGVDLFDRYTYFMDMAESVDQKAKFYFLVSNATDYDYRKLPSESKFKEIIGLIEDRGHEIGIHPSYSAQREELIAEEIERINQMVNSPVKHSRQHYLKYDSELPYILEKNGIISDSSIAYADFVGFRCGICYQYPMYDVHNRRTLNIMQVPLILMDVTLKKYRNYSPLSAIREIENIQKTIRKYNGTFTFLWHNSSFEIDGWQEFMPVLEKCYAA